MTPTFRAVLAAMATSVSVSKPSAARPLDLAVYESEGRQSGYLFLDAATRTLQDDDFQNSGSLALPRGEQLWSTPDGTEEKSCASYHGVKRQLRWPAETAIKRVAARYPAYDPEAGSLLNLELRINREREVRMGAAPLAYESDAMLALSACISAQSSGMPIAVQVDGPAAVYFEAGQAFYFRRREQLDLACGQCHNDLVGQRLRGDTISRGQIIGFPIHRLIWRKLASRHRIIEWCNTSLRAGPFPYGSEEYLAPELYMAWRGRGLPIESPAVRE